MKVEVAQQIPQKDAKTKSPDPLSPAQEGDIAAKDGSATGAATKVQPAGNGYAASKTTAADGAPSEDAALDKAAAEADAAIDAQLRKGPAVLISSPESEMARNAGYASFKTEEGFVTLGKAAPVSGLDALDKASLEKALDKAVAKAALEQAIGTAVDKAAIIAEAANQKSAAALLAGAAADKAGHIAEPLPKYMRDFSDKSLVQYAKALNDLKLPVRESTAAMMLQIMEGKDMLPVNLHDRLTLESAAFLASAGMRGQAETQAALDILGGAKMDTLINSLLLLLNGTDSAETHAAQSEKVLYSNTVTQKHTDGSDSAEPQSQRPADLNQDMATFGKTSVSTQTAGISDIFNLLKAADGSSLSEHLDPDLTSAPKSGANQTDNIAAQSEKAPKNNAAIQSEKVPHGNAVTQSEKVPHGNAVAQNENVPQSTITISQPQQSVQDQVKLPQIPLIESGMMGASIAVQDALATALSELPEFQNTPPKYILKFSETLTRVVGMETPVAEPPRVEDLHKQLEQLFTNIDRNDLGLGQRLSQSREELFLRLMLIEEAVFRMDFPQGVQIMEQVSQVLNHVRVLNNIEHLVYMQLPIILNEQETTAELYVFKKKGKKQIDPENVNLLMTLELEHMGRWEGLINIQNKDVYIKMDVPGEEQKGFLGANTVALHKLLHEIGFNLKNPTITFTGEGTTPLTAMLSFEQLSAGKKSGSGAMDFTV